MRNTDAVFQPSALAEVLHRRLGLPPATPLCVAYSGGLDSTVLLTALAALRTECGFPLRAVHVHHGLLAEADAWAQRARTVCAGLNVECRIEHVQIAVPPGTSVEAAARQARYGALARRLGAGEVLLTAHHRNDQAETLLLQLLRGSGAHGLAGMPELTAFAAGRLARPLLGFSRASLHDYARTRALSWIEDPSNQDPRFRRNQLRQELWPALLRAWPAADRSLARSAAHMADTAELLDEVAAADLAACRRTDPDRLDVAALAALSGPRRANLLRYWLRAAGFHAPSALHLGEILAVLRQEPRSGHARIAWSGVEVWRYRDGLYRRAAPDRPPAVQAWTLDRPLLWCGRALRARAAAGAGLSVAQLAGQRITVRPRHGGERCLLPGRAHHHKLKKLLQEAGVPPWERDCLPLLYVGDELAAVADRWVCAPYAARPGEAGLALVWEPAA